MLDASLFSNGCFFGELFLVPVSLDFRELALLLLSGLWLVLVNFFFDNLFLSLNMPSDLEFEDTFLIWPVLGKRVKPSLRLHDALLAEESDVDLVHLGTELPLLSDCCLQICEDLTLKA